MQGFSLGYVKNFRFESKIFKCNVMFIVSIQNKIQKRLEFGYGD